MLFETENVQDIYMSFRQMAEIEGVGDIQHEIDDTVWLKQIFGLNNGDPAVQNVGSIHLKHGRLVSYPSTVQCRIGPFELKDKTKKGHATALAIYLVDPNIRIISTANVPPQRIDWTREMEDLGPHRDELRSFPEYLYNRLLNRRDNFPFKKSEAEKMCVDAWDELVDFYKYQDVAFRSHTIEI